MKNSIASRGLRAALLAFSGTLLFALAACNNGYGPPVAGEPVSWGQQHYLNVQKAQANHDSGRSDRSSSDAGLGTH
jgi:hypothetical protein